MRLPTSAALVFTLLASTLLAQEPLPAPPVPPAAKPDRFDYARACPPETLVYLEIVGVRDLWADAKARALAAVPADQRDQIEKRFAQAADEFVEMVSKEFSTDIRGFAENLDDGMFALTDLRLPAPPPTGSEETRELGQVRATALVAIRTVAADTLSGLLTREVEKKTATTGDPVSGCPTYEIPLVKAPDPAAGEAPPAQEEELSGPIPGPESLLGSTLYIALDGPVGWFSNDRATLVAAVDRAVRARASSPTAPSLADDPGFAAARSRTGAGTYSFGYGDLGRIFDRVEQSLARDGLHEFQKADAHIGFRSLKAIASWGAVRGDQTIGGFSIEGTQGVSLYQAIRQAPSAKDLPAVIPADTGLAVFFSVPDPSAGWERLRAWLKENSELFGEKEFDEGLEKSETNMGATWTEIMAALDNEAAFFLLAAKPGEKEPRPGFCLEVKDPAASLALLDRLAQSEFFREANGGTPYVKRDFEGVAVYESGRPDGLHYACVGRALVFAPEAATIEAVIDAVRTEKVLSKSPRLAGGLTGLPALNSKLVYYDTGWFLQNFSSSGGLSTPDLELIKTMSADSGGVAVTIEDGDRLLVLGSSKLSAQALSSGLSFLLFSGMLDGNRRRAEEAQCANNLREIGMGLATWVDSHGGTEFPPDLAALQQELFADRPGLFLCPVEPPPEGPADFTTSYVFLPPVDFASLDPTMMLVFEPAPMHGESETVEVLFGDFHVESVPAPLFREALAEQCRVLEKTYIEAVAEADRGIEAATDATGRAKLTKRKEGLAQRAAEVSAMREAAEAAVEAGAPPPPTEEEDGPEEEAPPPK